MKVSYHRDLNKNYLILSDPEITGREYTLRMLAGNRIPGFLDLSVRTVNAECQLFYEITSKVSLTDAFEARQIGHTDLERIIGSVAQALQQAERYLIGTENISLDPEMMYLDPDTGKVSVLLMPAPPERKAGMTQEQILAEFVLRHLDHEDREAVDMGYAFYRMASEERFSFDAIEKALHEKKHEKDEREDFECEEEDPVLRGMYGAMRRTKEEEAGDGEQAYSGTPSEIKRREREWKKEERRAQKKKKRMSESADEQKRRKIIFWICVVLAGGIVYGVVLIIFRLDLTQAGGLAFLMLAVGWLITEAVIRKQREDKNHWSDEVDDEDELMEALLEELYDRESKETKSEYAYLGSDTRKRKDREYSKEENDGSRSYIPGGQSAAGKAGPGEPGKTRALVSDEVAETFTLVSQDPRRYRDIYLNGAAVVIGKSPELAQAVVDYDAVSRIHAKVEIGEDGALTITDLNSMNGVSVNGKMLVPMKPCALQEDDMVGIADLRYRLRRRG